MALARSPSLVAPSRAHTSSYSALPGRAGNPASTSGAVICSPVVTMAPPENASTSGAKSMPRKW